METASWVIVDLRNGKILMETFMPVKAEKANAHPNYKAIPVYEYLVGLNTRLQANH